MIEKIVTDYSDLLNKIGIEHKILEHPHFDNPEDVQEYLGEVLTDCVATLVMKADGRYLIILKRGDDHLDFKRIKKELKIKDLRFATKEEFVEKTKLPFGTARVYIPNTETYIDKRIFEKEFLNGGTGSFSCTFKYKTEDLRKIPGRKISDFSDKY